jgi:hypothetical protein
MYVHCVPILRAVQSTCSKSRDLWASPELVCRERDGVALDLKPRRVEEIAGRDALLLF